ncbi:tripeptidyl-peptidase 2 [Capsaspora owczarzaki ATCC 30864]|uniref:Tripeptidyl-peptidase 2 n=1 Tax=Capsaspora owczarzaki (strain ATCC 30864) TaxID=595528 RepID=A0A0D2X510_CAPO3|nr:tripeptidyl-peptidase 2 [Capsaspora owczarzaki ATCC 30864]KJE96994.1 tripeptidyl-peptidase 2 [Capsaspora owczarzaki ATCC 30864]|eukprot:XP_004343357.1 tripeptidyl-peptidase 2 [Capsaspora owczarzaki ATCC 30864]
MEESGNQTASQSQSESESQSQSESQTQSQSQTQTQAQTQSQTQTQAQAQAQAHGLMLPPDWAALVASHSRSRTIHPSTSTGTGTGTGTTTGAATNATTGGFPVQHLMPKSETGADRFVADHPTFDGRGVVVAIFDTGVDPAAAGLQVTSDGRPKLIDTIDATGSGDVEMLTVRSLNPDGRTVDAAPTSVSAAAGLKRKLTLPREWIASNPTGVFRVGTKRAYELLPKVLVARLKSERRKIVELEEKQLMAALQQQLASLHGSSCSVPASTANVAAPAAGAVGANAAANRLLASPLEIEFAASPLSTRSDPQPAPAVASSSGATTAATAAATATSAASAGATTTAPTGSPTAEERRRLKEDLEARIEQLTQLTRSLEDCGPVYDCVAFHDGSHWRAALDTTETGDFSFATLLTDYYTERRFAQFGLDDMASYAINIYDDGAIVSVVVDAGAHGTHVAGIVGANFPDEPSRNGMAPGAQLISVKIGDTRLGSMETGTAFVRGLTHALKRKVDLINLSYGEPTSLCEQGRIIELCSEIVNKHGVIFVSSAGNNGPALTTVGAPGGVCSAVIGVGAYVSNDMMRAEYSMHTPADNAQFTWSSRGPSADGHLGVSISAPGAAIVSVPTWTLKSQQLMNGTSMASPNACGGLALLLSGLKALHIPYTPHHIRRAVENTATNRDCIEPFAIGHGLLSIPHAYKYLCDFHNVSDMDAVYTVTLPDRGDARGLYLRELHENLQPFEEQVHVNATFREDTDNNQQRVAFEARFRLVSTAPFVQCPDHLVLMHEGRSFHIRVDPTALPLDGSVRYGEILAFNVDAPARGPIFRLPITVIRPLPVLGRSIGAPLRQTSEGRVAGSSASGSGVVGLPLSQQQQEQQSHDATALHEDPTPHLIRFRRLPLSAGRVVRKFVTVPSGASWVEVRLSLRGATLDARRFVLHALQLQPQRRYNTMEYHKLSTVVQDTPSVHKFAVLPDVTLELCIAQWWASVGDTELDVTAEFSGLQLLGASNAGIHLNGSELAARVDITSPLRREEVMPSITLKTWRQALKPGEYRIAPLSTARDTLLDGQRLYELVVSYKFSQADSMEVQITVPVVSDLLYESPFEAQFWSVYDSNKRRLFSGDAFPSHYALKLDKGDYVVRLQLRHEKIDVLERCKDFPVMIERSLTKSQEVSLDIFPSYKAALANGARVRAQTVAPGSILPCYIGCALPASRLPRDCRAGDQLVGALCLSKQFTLGSNTSAEAVRRLPASVPITLSISAASFTSPTAVAIELPATSSSSSSSTEPELTEVDRFRNSVRDVMIAGLARLHTKTARADYDQVYASLLQLHPDHLPLHVAHLQAIDTPDSKDRREILPSILAAADQVVQLCAPAALAAHFGVNHDASTLGQAEVAKTRRAMESKRDTLVDALARKARALVELGACNFGSAPFINRHRGIEADATASRPVAEARVSSPTPSSVSPTIATTAAAAAAAAAAVLSQEIARDDSAIALTPDVSTAEADAAKPSDKAIVLSSFDAMLQAALPTQTSASAMLSSGTASAADSSATSTSLNQLQLDAMFDTTMATLSEWISLQDAKVVHLFVHREVGRGRFGAALRAVNKQLGLDAFHMQSATLQAAVYELRFAIVLRLAWHSLAANERRFQLIRFPLKYASF